MPRVTLTKTAAPGAYPSAGVAITFTAADTVNKEQFVFTGREMVIARNVGASTRTVTLTSAANARGRVKHISAENIAAGAQRVYGPFTNKDGWQQSGGYFFLEANHAEVEFAVVQLP